jgi:hypothetical protein
LGLLLSPVWDYSQRCPILVANSKAVQTIQSLLLRPFSSCAPTPGFDATWRQLDPS